MKERGKSVDSLQGFFRLALSLYQPATDSGDLQAVVHGHRHACSLEQVTCWPDYSFKSLPLVKL